MKTLHALANPVVAAILAALVLVSAVAAPPAAADPERELDALFETLADPDLSDWEPIEEEIWRRWSQSGSAAMDLLLGRAREALEAGEIDVAIEHLTALTDHAPGFAEGWNARAAAFYRVGRFGPAMADLRRALALNPRHFGALAGLGVLLEETGDETGALAAYRAALAVHPHRPNLIEAERRLDRKVSGKSI